MDIQNVRDLVEHFELETVETGGGCQAYTGYANGFASGEAPYFLITETGDASLPAAEDTRAALGAYPGDGGDDWTCAVLPVETIADVLAHGQVPGEYAYETLLSAELEQYCDEHALPWISADELLRELLEIPNAERHVQWVREFIRRWEVLIEGKRSVGPQEAPVNDVAAHFRATFGRDIERASQVAAFALSSECGGECQRAIDAAANFIGHIRASLGDDKFSIDVVEDYCERIVLTYCFG